MLTLPLCSFFLRHLDHISSTIWQNVRLLWNLYTLFFISVDTVRNAVSSNVQHVHVVQDPLKVYHNLHQFICNEQKANTKRPEPFSDANGLWFDIYTHAFDSIFQSSRKYPPKTRARAKQETAIQCVSFGVRVVFVVVGIRHPCI